MLKAWRISWKDECGRKQKRYRTSQRTALTRLTRAKTQGTEARIDNIEIPTCKFELIDFLNREMDDE